MWRNWLSRKDRNDRPGGGVAKYIKSVISSHKGALAWYGKLTWESSHAWILIILYYLIVWGITLIFMVRLSFYAMTLLIYDVMNDITIKP